ncbi:MAG: elongation factor G [Candidatus Tectomicrobia bacterium]|uniref:Elongation factor G n=1 Tax=Tectimicrobiota bacterium TaxID=2528274 RepID=A0A932I0H7_UNCTE|nr:elongation factor G [Candidatus Tectomicrobia bacterium]
MAAHEIARIRNVGLLGEGGNGKTSLAEACLFTSGSTDRLGKVDAGSTILDSEPEEVKRSSSIASAVAFADWDKHRVNLIDTPGYSNFIADTVAAIRAMDNALIVIRGHSELKVMTEKVFEWTQAEGIPRFLYVNHMDHPQADIFRAVEAASSSLEKRFALVHLPIGGGEDFKGIVDLLAGKAYTYAPDGNGKGTEEPIPADLKAAYEEHRGKLIECAAEADESLIEKYLEGGELAPEEIVKGLRKGILEGAFIPVFCGCGMKNIGTDALLNALVMLGASPAERRPAEAEGPEDQKLSLKADSDGPFCALVFKTVVDPFAGKLNYFRVMSGTLAPDAAVLNAAQGEKERIGGLLFIQGKGQKPVTDKLVPGDIAAVAKLKVTRTGDTLCDEKSPLKLAPIKFPSPSISYAVAPKSKGDEEKLSTAFSRIREEDPVLQVSRDPQTKELLLSGLGVLHIEVAIERIKRKYGVEVEMRTPRVPYKETIKGRTKVQGRYKKQTGGRGQFGDTWLEIEPLPRGKGFEFVDKIVGGSIPRTYIPAVEKGIVEAMENGSLAGYPVTDLRITLYDGSYHTVDSSEMAFKIAGSMGFKKGMLECKPTLLEPIMNIEVTVPDEYMGDIIGDLNSRRGRVLGMIPGAGGKQAIKAQVPMAEVLNYAPALRSMTADRGDFTMEFSHYEEVPGQIAEKVIAAAGAPQSSDE